MAQFCDPIQVTCGRKFSGLTTSSESATLLTFTQEYALRV